MASKLQYVEDPERDIIKAQILIFTHSSTEDNSIELQRA